MTKLKLILIKMSNDNCFKLEAQNRRLVFEVSSSSLKDIQMVIVTLNKPDIKLTSNILQIVSPLVRNVVNDRCCQCDTPTIILPDVDARTLELLVTLLHHGEVEITGPEKEDMETVLLNIRSLAVCLQMDLASDYLEVIEKKRLKVLPQTEDCTLNYIQNTPEESLSSNQAGHKTKDAEKNHRMVNENIRRKDIHLRRRKHNINERWIMSGPKPKSNVKKLRTLQRQRSGTMAQMFSPSIEDMCSVCGAIKHGAYGDCPVCADWSYEVQMEDRRDAGLVEEQGSNIAVNINLVRTRGYQDNNTHDPNVDKKPVIIKIRIPKKLENSKPKTIIKIRKKKQTRRKKLKKSVSSSRIKDLRKFKNMKKDPFPLVKEQAKPLNIHRNPTTIKQRMENVAMYKKYNENHQDDIFEDSPRKLFRAKLLEDEDTSDDTVEDDALYSPRSPVLPPLTREDTPVWCRNQSKTKVEEEELFCRYVMCTLLQLK